MGRGAKNLLSLLLAGAVLLALGACGRQESGTGGEQEVAVGDTGAVCRVPDAFSPLRWGDGYMTLSDPGQTAFLAVEWKTDSLCADLYDWLAWEGLGSEGLVRMDAESAEYDLRAGGGGLCWVLYRAPVGVTMTFTADKTSPWYDFSSRASLSFTAAAETAAPVSAEADAYLSKTTAFLLAHSAPETAQELADADVAVRTDELRAVAAWMVSEGLDRYISSARNGGLYLAETADGYDVGVYAGNYSGDARQGDGCVWFTCQADGNRLYTGAWADDRPEGDFSCAVLTAEYQNLLLFSGACARGVWSGEIALRYTDETGAMLTGSFQCDAGSAPVVKRDNGDFWNEDMNDRFCYAVLSGDGDTVVPLYRSWTDRDFVMRMAYDKEVLKDE